MYVQTYAHSRKLYCFFMHIDFLFLCYRSARARLHPLASHSPVLSNMSNDFKENFRFSVYMRCVHCAICFYGTTQQCKIDNLCENALVMATDLLFYFIFFRIVYRNFLQVLIYKSSVTTIACTMYHFYFRDISQLLLWKMSENVTKFYGKRFAVLHEVYFS